MNDHKFDRYFRERLSSHSESPPQSLWQGIEARVIPGKNTRWGDNWKTMLGGLLLVIALLGLGIAPEQDVHIQLAASSPETAGQADAIRVTEEAIHAVPAAGGLFASPVRQVNESIQPIKPVEDAVQAPALNQEASLTVTESPDLPAAEPSTGMPAATAPSPKTSPRPEYKAHVADIFPFEPPSIATRDKEEPLSQEINTEADPLPETNIPLPRSPGPRLTPYFGFSYIPERLLNDEQIEKPVWNHSAGIHMGMQYSSFLLETGLWFSQNRDSWDYAVNYLSKDSVNWYWDVVSVYFIPLLNQFGDTIGWEPQFQAIQVSMFDSVAHDYSESIEMRYSYMHIPFYIGIRRPVPGIKGFSYAVKAGFIFSKATSASEPIPGFDPQDVRITDIYDQRLLRNHNMMQWTISSELNYRLSQHWSVFVEPNVRFYRGAYFRKPDGSLMDRSGSIGLRTGITVNF